MSVAPPAKNRFSTSFSALYSALPEGTWKLPEVPMPMAGTFSPDDGMVRMRMALPEAASARPASPELNNNEPAVMAEDWRNWRRVLMATPGGRCLFADRRSRAEFRPLLQRGGDITIVKQLSYFLAEPFLRVLFGAHERAAGDFLSRDLLAGQD